MEEKEIENEKNDIEIIRIKNYKFFLDLNRISQKLSVFLQEKNIETKENYLYYEEYNCDDFTTINGERLLIPPEDFLFFISNYIRETELNIIKIKNGIKIESDNKILFLLNKVVYNNKTRSFVIINRKKINKKYLKQFLKWTKIIDKFFYIVNILIIIFIAIYLNIILNNSNNLVIKNDLKSTNDIIEEFKLILK